MYVNVITEKLDGFDKLPYKCIFFNGLWGVGKSYAADSVKNKDKIIRVSLSGVKTADEIYTEILDTFIGKSGFTNVVSKVAGTVVKATSNIDQTKISSGIISDITQSFLSAKAALNIYLKKQQKLRVIILDDFERIWDGIDITEVFHVVEFLTNQRNVKVALIGDLTKLSNDTKEKFNKYSERYIDRIYNITDIPIDINWEDEPLCIEKSFILEFKAMHGFQNLRSVIKANDFYKDIRFTLLNNSKRIRTNSKNFWNDVRLTAFAIVIESIDKLKLTSSSNYSLNLNYSPRCGECG